MGIEKITEEIPKVKSFLERTLERKREEVAASRAHAPLDVVAERAEARGPARSLSNALRGPGVAVIAEIKRRSPSAGELASELDGVARARLYQDAGAAAISVLTDAAFDGSLEDLRAVADAIDIPILRKDFLIDPYQVWESRAHGADAVLLIAAALEGEALVDLVETTKTAGVGTLLEVHSSDELARLRGTDLDVLGINARDLRSLDVSVTRGLELLSTARETLGDAPLLVAESGIDSAADVEAAGAAGADAVLVGEHLMRARDPAAALRDLVSGGR